MDYFLSEDIYQVPEAPLLEFINQPEDRDTQLIVFLTSRDNSADNMALLEKICGASGFDFASQVSVILVTENEAVSFGHLASRFKTTPMIFFGLSNDVMTTQFHQFKYEWISLNGNRLLFSDSFTDLGNNQKLKQQLWIALKEEFKN
jgi:hypothetical protein